MVFEDGVSWSELTHAHGPASDIPAVLDALVSGDQAGQTAALGTIHDVLAQQGTLYPATAPIVDGVLTALGRPGILSDEQLVTALRMIAEVLTDATRQPDPLRTRYEHALDRNLAESDAEQDRLGRQVRQAVGAHTAPLLALLDHPAAPVRAAAAHLVGLAGDPTGELVEALERGTDRDVSAASAASMTIAVGMLLARHAEDMPEQPPLREAAGWLAERLAAADPMARAAAAVGSVLAGHGARELVRQALAESLREPPATWTDVPWTQLSPTSLQWQALGEDLEARLDVLARALDAPQPRQRHDLVGHADAAMQRWRAAPAEVVPLLVARADDTHPQVRQRVITAIAWAGRATTTAVNTLAELLDQWAPGGIPLDSPGGEWDHVGEPRAAAVAGAVRAGAAAAVEGLARLGDIRALPTLATDLVEPRLALDLEAALAGMAARADVLVPGVRSYLERGAPAAPARSGARLPALARGIASWGPAAAPLVPALAALLATSPAKADLSLALGRIGPAAQAAVSALTELLHAEHPDDRAAAAWALLTITGDPDEPLAALTTALTEDPRGAAERLAEIDLGALPQRVAAPAVDRLRPLLDADNLWVRAAAARAVWSAVRDPATVLDVLIESLCAVSTGLPAVRTLAEIGPERAAAVAALTDVVASPYRISDRASIVPRRIIDDEAYQQAAADALARMRGGAD